MVDSDEETPCEIKLALAQEFLDLGLLPGAREIAVELLESPQADVREKAHVLLSAIQEKEGADDMPLFETSAFVDPTTLSVSTAAQLLATDASGGADQDDTVHWRD